MPSPWTKITEDPNYARLTSAQQATLLGEWQRSVETEASRTLRPLKRDADLVAFWTELDAYGQEARQTIAAGAEKQDALVTQGPLSLAGKAKAAGEAFLEGSARVGTGILTGIGMLGRETEGALEATARAVGKELPPKQGEGLVEKAAELNERVAKQYERDPRAKGSLALDQLPQGAATLLGLFTPGAAAKVAGLPTKAATALSALTGASLEGAEQYHSAVAAGAPERVALKAWASGMAIGSTDALPLARPLARVAEKLDKASGGAFRRAILNAGVSGVEEAMQEFFQTSAGNAAAVALYEEAPDRFTGLAEGSGDAAAVGGILGAVLGAVTTQGRRAGRTGQTTQGQDTLPMPAEPVEVLPPQALPGPSERIIPPRAATQATGQPTPSPAPQLALEDGRALPAPPPATSPPQMLDAEATTEAPRALLPEPAPDPIAESWDTAADETTAPNAPETWGVPLGAVDPVHRVWERVRSSFRSRGDLPQSAFEIRLEAEGQQAAIAKQAEQNVRRIEGALRQLHGRGWTRQSQADRAAALNAINQVMTGQAQVQSLPAALQAPVRAARQHIDALSLDYVREGIAQGPLVQTILDGMGTYVNRAYEKFDNPRWRDQVDPGVVANAVGLIRRQTPRQAGESLADYERRVHGIVEALLVENTDSPVDSAARGALSRKDLSNLRRRRDIAPEIRALWGEYSNPIQNYARTVAKMGHTLAAHRNLTALRQDGLGEYLFEEPQPGFADRISAEGNAAMAPLDGLYTSREIRDALLKGHQTGADLMPGWKALLTFSAAAKYSKTVLSIVTQVRNFLSNTIYTVALGNVPTTGATTAMRAMAAELLPHEVLQMLGRGGYDRASWEAYVRRKVELGVLENAVGAQELRDVMRDSLVGDVDMATWARNRAQRWAAQGARTASRLYAAGDGFWKILNHEAEMRKYRAAFPNWPADRLERHAARIVRDTMPSYGLVPDVVKGLRRVPFIAPFVSFTAEVVRNNANLVSLTRQELANPATRAIGARRLAGLIAAHSLPIGAWMLSRYLTGTDDEEEDGIRALSAPWDENAMLVHLGKGTDGQVRFVNLSYIDPFSWFKNPLVAVMRGDIEGEQAQMEALVRMAEPFIGEDLAMGGLVDVLRNQTKDGRQIYNPTAPAREKWQRISAHLWSKAEPGAIAQAERVYMGVTGKRTPYGRSYNAQDEMIALATGQRIVQLDPANALLFKGLAFRKDETAAAQNFTSVIGRRGTVTDDQIANAWEVARISREKVWQKAIAATNGALELGQSPQAVYSTLRAAGVPKVDSVGMIMGQQIPWTMTQQQIEKVAGIPGRLPQLLRVLPREAWDVEALKKTLQRPSVRQQLRQAGVGAGAG